MRQHRRFLLCQLVGFMMMGASFSLVVRPYSAVIDNNLVLIFAISFFVCGWTLAYQQHASHFVFFILTTPILLLSATYGTFVLLHPEVSAIPAYLMTCFDVALQYCHARQEEWRKWTSR